MARLGVDGARSLDFSHVSERCLGSSSCGVSGAASHLAGYLAGAASHLAICHAASTASVAATAGGSASAWCSTPATTVTGTGRSTSMPGHRTAMRMRPQRQVQLQLLSA